MNPLIKKEIRLLLPAWVAAMLLAVGPPVFIWGAWKIESPNNVYSDLQPYFFMQTSIVPIVFALGVLLLGISSFGQELNFGSFGALLSQPAERQRIWLVKVLTLAIAFVLVWLTAILLVSGIFEIWKGAETIPFFVPSVFKTWKGPETLPAHVFHPHWHVVLESFKSQALENLTLCALVTFSGGLWTTLLLRQTTGAFWFTLLTPLAIVLAIFAVLQDWLAWDINFNRFIVIALVLYSIIGFVWAWRLFLHAQDTQWGGGEMSLPWRGKNSGVQTISLFKRRRHWLSALAGKEIQLHQASLVIAAMMFFLHLACIVIRKTHAAFEGSALRDVVEGFWVLWLLMPLLIGATAFAEERRIGILESQLCAPVSRRAQFLVKFSVALALSLILGAVMPRLMEGPKVIDDWIFFVAAGICFIAFYTSSLARTTLQAIEYAMLFVAAIYTGICLYNYFDLMSLDEAYFMTSVLFSVLIWLAYWNFKGLHLKSKVWACNTIVILATLIFALVLDHFLFFYPCFL